MARATTAQLTLVLGGARSGKSAYAEQLVMASPGPWTYLATAQAFDREMEQRIAAHQSRRGTGWLTEAVPLDLVPKLAVAPLDGPLMIDCLTLWLTNVMLADKVVADEADALVKALRNRTGLTVAVSNEVGMGIVPDNELARAFRDAAGRLHQKLAAVADRVVLVVAGIPMVIKQ